MGLYEKYLLPKLINAACGAKPITRQRAKVVPLARGRVLEIGVGAGHNLPHYDAANIEMLYALEPSAEMRALAADRVNDVAFKVEFIDLPGEAIPLEDQSVDTVVTTFTLCTIPDTLKALQGMLRVLRPDGQLLFCEHGIAPDAAVAKWQNRINPIWKPIGGGCNINRAIPALIEGAGFKISDLQSMYLPSTPRIMGYNYWGSARR
ncbi:MAG: class I SAM-dependent methyltransferase [Alphaproteobacteria bacterium]|nr:class I SAM-dependent methyltransferase [Alphaproteobacteria bacterium]